jgi:hypothetical protein
MVFTGGITGAMRWGYPKGGLFTIFFHVLPSWREYWGNEVVLPEGGLFTIFFLVCLDAQLPIFPKLVYNYIAY